MKVAVSAMSQQLKEIQQRIEELEKEIIKVLFEICPFCWAYKKLK